MPLDWRNNRNFDYFSPKLRYFSSDYGSLECFYQNFNKIHPNNTNNTNYTHQKIEPIKAGFSTNDRLGFMVPTYADKDRGVVVFYGSDTCQ